MGSFSEIQRLSKPPIPQEIHQQRFEADQLEDLLCEYCGSPFWEPVTIWKKLPAEKAADKQIHYKNIILNRCADCKKISTKDEKNFLYGQSKSKG